jgi:hypothetical protein
LNKKAALEPDKFLTGIVIFTLFLTTGVLFLHDLNSTYDDIDLEDSKFDNNFNMTGELYNLSQELDEAGLGELDEDDIPNSMFKGAYSAIRLLKNSYKLVGNVMDSFARVIPVPEGFKTLALIILLILIVFSVAYLVFRFQPRK